MKAQLGACLIAFCCVGAFAQSNVQELTFEQLQDARRSEEARFLALEQACYLRFAVNDCLQQVRADRRLVMDELRRKEVIINDLERQKKAAAQLELIKEKNSLEQLDLENSRRQEALKAHAERESSAANKRAEQLLKPLPTPLPKPSSPAAVPSRTADDAAKNKLDFDRKLKEAQERRESREKRRLEKKADKPALPLPLE